MIADPATTAVGVYIKFIGPVSLTTS
jgi:hypothetical protein